jgi:NAD(P)-dependent dehydrogenase (short-subunit alcohol dehydrogenase family)
MVTGGASGIGRALAIRFAREGARGVAVVDRDAAAARGVADECGGLALEADVADEAALVGAIDRAEAALGPIALFCGNAGVGAAGGVEAPDPDWQRGWQVNVMAHVYAARRLVGPMLARGGGHFLITASAAGLLSQIGSAPYTATKHAAVAFAEWLAITHGADGLGVSCLCPQGVRTGMLNDSSGPAFLLRDALEPDAVADCVIEGLRHGRFLLLPHAEVAEYERAKAADRERWIAAMQRLQAKVGERARWERSPS